MWFLHQLEGPSPTYNVPMALRLSGSLDREALRAALGDVVARHESLRTVFAEDAAGACQVVLDADDVRVPWGVDRVGEEELPERLAETARYAFDLTARSRSVPPCSSWVRTSTSCFFCGTTSPRTAGRCGRWCVT
ncbi:condensation domain-containing protein [Streptomyces tubbatahanensis]|uniref:condensation domain-containing protein n=1 Tax=Streptomyces tubbatahanensis TaxID=2923272 RepID=UPI00237CF574|nr:condensation domain-containing protein [Streptomyces tubbatahanensis]